MSQKDIESWFCTYFGIKKQKITDAKFLKVLRICWELKLDMNFDNNPDFEDLQYIRSQDFKYYILEALSTRDYYSNKSLESKLQEELGQ